MPVVSALLLAAGGSRRMGKPKQLIEVEGETLLKRSLRALCLSNCDRVSVVVGSCAEELRACLDDFDGEVFENKNWEAGMGESIKVGLGQLLERESPDAVLLCVCDQPHLDAGVINGLLASYEATGKGIAVCDYGDAHGPPVVFTKQYFRNLLELSGDEGARSVIKAFSGDVSCYRWEKGAIDWDTPEDVREE